MLASVPLVVVAERRIFLPESERERDLRVWCDYVNGMMARAFADSFREVQRHLLERHGLIISSTHGPMPRVQLINSLADVEKFFG